ncbi:MAG: hypothetical protein R8K48_00235 [Gallionella sp.]
MLDSYYRGAQGFEPVLEGGEDAAQVLLQAIRKSLLAVSLA